MPASLTDRVVSAVDAVASAIGPKAANAQAGFVYGDIFSMSLICTPKVPNKVNHFDLFRAMGVAWRGCVEARPYPLDVRDVRPSNSDPDSFFVPYLWPDEQDGNSNVRNNYYEDWNARHTPSWVYNRHDDRLAIGYVWKYAFRPDRVDDNAFIQQGPNAGCPDPIVPLTETQGSVISAISQLRTYGGGGTNSVEGLAWAWRTISPNGPFGNAQPYDRANKKIIVLMTDGMNESVPQNTNFRSDYTATGYAASNRLGTTDPAQMAAVLNTRLAELCNNVKAQDIEIYTVLYDSRNSMPADIGTLFRNCATSPTHYYYRVTSPSTLRAAFDAIAGNISKLRLAR